MKDEKSISGIEIFFLALSDYTRLRLLNLMRQDEVSVSYLVKVLDETQPKISRHLSVMRRAGLVEAKRQGKLMIYKITQPVDDLAAEVLMKTLDWLDSQEILRQDYDKLVALNQLSNGSATTPQLMLANVSAEADMIRRESKKLEVFLL